MATLTFEQLKEAGPTVCLAIIASRKWPDGTGYGAYGTSTVTSVADNAASVTLLAANASRLGATIFNSSSARLYIKLGTTASTTSYSASVAQNASYMVPDNYVGRIDGIWATDPNDGAALITEFT